MLKFEYLLVRLSSKLVTYMPVPVRYILFSLDQII